MDFIIFRRDWLGRGGGVMLVVKDSIFCYWWSDFEIECEVL